MRAANSRKPCINGTRGRIERAAAVIPSSGILPPTACHTGSRSTHRSHALPPPARETTHHACIHGTARHGPSQASEEDGQPVPPKRTRKPPGHLRDFIVDRIQQAGLVTVARFPSTRDQTPKAPGQLLTPEQCDGLLKPCKAHAV